MQRGLLLSVWAVVQPEGGRKMLSDFDRAHIADILAGHGTWFTADLLRLCAHADAGNLERLRLAFPEVVEAYVAWREGRA